MLQEFTMSNKIEGKVVAPVAHTLTFGLSVPQRQAHSLNLAKQITIGSSTGRKRPVTNNTKMIGA
jgi:hypothetical protein